MYKFPIELYESPIELLDDDIFSNLKERRDDHIYTTNVEDDWDDFVEV